MQATVHRHLDTLDLSLERIDPGVTVLITNQDAGTLPSNTWPDGYAR